MLFSSITVTLSSWTCIRSLLKKASMDVLIFAILVSQMSWRSQRNEKKKILNYRLFSVQRKKIEAFLTIPLKNLFHRFVSLFTGQLFGFADLDRGPDCFCVRKIVGCHVKKHVSGVHVMIARHFCQVPKFQSYEKMHEDAQRNKLDRSFEDHFRRKKRRNYWKSEDLLGESFVVQNLVQLLDIHPFRSNNPALFVLSQMECEPDWNIDGNTGPKRSESSRN